MLVVRSAERWGAGAREIMVAARSLLSDRACLAGPGFRIGATTPCASLGVAIGPARSTTSCVGSGLSVATRAGGIAAVFGGAGRMTVSVGCRTGAGPGGRIGAEVGLAGRVCVGLTSTRGCDGCSASGSSVATADCGTDITTSRWSVRSFQTDGCSCGRRAASSGARPISGKRGLARGGRKAVCSDVSVGFGSRKLRGPSATVKVPGSSACDRGPVKCGTSTHAGKVAGGGASADTIGAAGCPETAKAQSLRGTNHTAPAAKTARVERQETEIVAQAATRLPGLTTARGRATPTGFRSPTKMGPRCNILSELVLARNSSRPR